MLQRFSVSDLHAICERYERLAEDSPPIARRPTTEEYTNARAALEQLQMQKGADGHSKQILQMVHRIDQHLDVMEEKIDNAPVRTDSPKLNQMEAQMEAMKAMMEAMRLEKERQEQELAAVKLRAEQEAKLRAEQEEARELLEIHKRLHETNMKSYCWMVDDKNKALLSSLMQREVILFCRQSDGRLTYIITNKNIFQVQRQNRAAGPVLCSIYTFNATLTKKQIIFLEKGIATHIEDLNCQPQADLLERLSRYHYIRNGQTNNCHEITKKFESVVRIIPGSYQNGDWRQLDGFFGMYYNEKTMEVSEYPPCSQ